MISYKSFLTERDKCVRGGHIPGCAQERAIALRAREERAQHRNSLSEGRAASTACRWPALYRSSSAIQLPGESLKWELKGTDLPVRHCTEKQQLKCHTTAETKPKEEQSKDQPENSLKPCQKSSFTTEQVRVAAVANAAENTPSAFEGRDSGFSPTPKGTSSGADPC